MCVRSRLGHIYIKYLIKVLSRNDGNTKYRLLSVRSILSLVSTSGGALYMDNMPDIGIT